MRIKSLIEQLLEIFKPSSQILKIFIINICCIFILNIFYSIIHPSKWPWLALRMTVYFPSQGIKTTFPTINGRIFALITYTYLSWYLPTNETGRVILWLWIALSAVAVIFIVAMVKIWAIHYWLDIYWGFQLYYKKLKFQNRNIMLI